MNRVEIDRDERMNNYLVEESFKAIRANLMFCGADIKVVLLTSCQASEGKSTVSAELAYSLSAIGKKVLLVDADLRKSSLLTRLAPAWHGEMMGMSQYLSGQATAEEVLFHTQYENLDVIFAGKCPPNPADLAGSARFKALLDESKQQYDYILVDTPPVGIVIDAAMIAPYCDGAIMVVSLDDVGARAIRAAQMQIEKSGCRILGVILNEASKKKRGFGIFSSKNKYADYYKNKNNQK